MEKTAIKNNHLNSYRHHLIENLYNSGHNCNVLIQKGDPWDDVSHCNSWQVAIKMKAVNLATHFSKKSFISNQS